MAGPTLTVVTASTRPLRVGGAVAQWFLKRARQYGGFDVVSADLQEIGLPLLDEPEHPRFGRYVHEHTRRWSAIVDASDAFVFVMPEYNHGLTAPLKNAIDCLHREWQYKPLGIVSYGGVAAGTRAAQQLKQVVLALKMVPMLEAVNIGAIATLIDDERRFRASDTLDRAAATMLTELGRWAVALRPLRPPAA